MSSEKLPERYYRLDPQRVGERIKEIRGRRTQEEFADLLGVKPPTVTRYEKGRVPEAGQLLRIAELDPLGRGVGWLLLGQQEAAGAVVRENRTSYEITSPPGYEALSQREQQIVDRLIGLMETADQDVVEHLRKQIELLLRIQPTPRKRA